MGMFDWVDRISEAMDDWEDRPRSRRWTLTAVGIQGFICAIVAGFAFHAGNWILGLLTGCGVLLFAGVLVAYVGLGGSEKPWPPE